MSLLHCREIEEYGIRDPTWCSLRHSWACSTSKGISIRSNVIHHRKRLVLHEIGACLGSVPWISFSNLIRYSVLVAMYCRLGTRFTKSRINLPIKSLQLREHWGPGQDRSLRINVNYTSVCLCSLTIAQNHSWHPFNKWLHFSHDIELYWVEKVLVDLWKSPHSSLVYFRWYGIWAPAVL